MDGPRIAATAAVVRPLPVTMVAAGAAVTAWHEHGSIAVQDWAPFGVFAALVLAVATAAAAARPARAAVIGTGALVLLAVWTGASAAWSPSPAGARDEALLAGFYAVALLIPLLTLPGPAERTWALAAVVLALGVVAALTAADLALAGRPQAFFYGGRLDYPLEYVNACAAFFALGFWPALVLAARRGGSPAARAACFAAAALFAALAAAAQSKGTLLGFAVSAAVVFAVAPARLRLLTPAALAIAPAAAAFRPLTAAYRSQSTAAAHRPGFAALAVLGAGVLLGAAYLLADSRIGISPRFARAAALLVLTALVVVTAVVVVRTDWGAKWRAFKHPNHALTGSSHLLSLGSNRYDFWRVAVGEAERHPMLGSGARGFYTVYLQHRRSPETPLRAHSLYLDALSEEGVPGLLLLLTAIGALFVLLVRRRARPTAVAALGAGTCFFVHAGVDWIWTLPVVGVPAFLLVGIGSAGDDGRPPPRRISLLGAMAAVALALFAFAPPWLSYRYVSAAYSAANPNPDLRLARLLDPLSLEPYFARWRLAATPADRVAALEAARRQEPDSVAVLYQLGLAYLQAGHSDAARRTFAQALQLDPREPAIRAALAGVRSQA